MTSMRVMLVDDQVLFRRALVRLLAAQDGIEVVGEASDGNEAIAMARTLRPELILMDVQMPNCSGLEAVRAIKQEMPEIYIVMLTVSDADSDLFAAIKAGAEGYLLKNLEPYQLCDMLKGVRRGEVAISGAVAAKMLREFKRVGTGEQTTQPGQLTSRELDVLGLVATGASNKEIAAALCLTENSVKVHLSNILSKLHLQNRVQAAVYAVREGLAKGVPPSTAPKG